MDILLHAVVMIILVAIALLYAGRHFKIPGVGRFLVGTSRGDG